MNEKMRAERYTDTMREIQRLEDELERLRDQQVELWGEMGAYARDLVGLMGAER